MSRPNRSEKSTRLFCRTKGDGTITPSWNPEEDKQRLQQFGEGYLLDERYLLKQLLGEGGMGRVFLAKDNRLDRFVAIKVVAHDSSDNPELNEVLRREAKLGANLNHNGIASVYDFGFHDQKSFTVFEYVEGESLRQLIDRRIKFPLSETVQIIQGLADALDFAHSQGVVHRDLKPENISLTRQGEFKILDLGIARNLDHDSDEKVYCGTPAYSSPEQADCRPTDGKSDQYALALITYELLTGERPFFADDVLEMLMQQIEGDPRPMCELDASIPDSVEQTVIRALSKSPANRFPTCTDFAKQLAKCTTSTSTIRHMVGTPVEQRIGFYVAHAGEDSSLASNVASKLESAGYSCWFFGRDGVPGISTIEQARGSMQKSHAVVLLICLEALRHPDFRREVEIAHQIGCPMIPILIGLSLLEFEQVGSAWTRLFNKANVREFNEFSETVESILSTISESAQELKIPNSDPGGPVNPPIVNEISGQTWATDANQIDIHDLDRVLFTNAAVEEFLYGKHRHFISATKGFGKTLLLTSKRHALTRSAQESRQSLTMIPEGRPYLDFMSEMKTLSTNYEKPLSEISNTKRLWNAALRISLISHFPSLIEESELDEIEEFPKRIQRWMRGAKIQPTVVFKELTALRVSEFNRLIDHTDNFLDQKMRQIHGGTMVFVDKVDQAIRHLSRDSWVAIQAGLIEAAWETMNANSHIKIFASIRQEAFANYQSDIKANLYSATTNLNYSEDELRALVNQLANCYESKSTFGEFLGFNVLRHGQRPVPEDSFRYVRRHTCGRPRDLVAIASQISSHKADMKEKKLKEIVRHTSSTVVVSNIFDEVRVFLGCLDDRDARLRFFSFLDANILEKSEAIRICENFNGLEEGTLQHFGEESDEIYHPFNDLFLAGMLGVIEKDGDSTQMKQRFRQPNDAFAGINAELPDSPVFLIHPALDAVIRTQQKRSNFLQYEHIAVGENLIWQPYFPKIMQIERQLAVIEDQDFLDLAHQIVKRIQAQLRIGSAPFARIEIEQSDPWRELWSKEGDPRFADTVFWIAELLSEL